MLVGGTFLDRLRPLVGSNGWDYCVVWRLNEEQGVLEGHECCCAAAVAACVNNLDKRDELLLPVSSGFSCRDVSFRHQKSTCCEFLSQLPSSVPLDDSGVYSEVLFSSQPRWFNILDSPNTENTPEETTRVLIPVPGGLVELFVSKQVLEDQQVVDFVVDQYSNQLEHEAFHVSSLMTQIPEAFTNGYDMDVTLVNGVPATNGEPYMEHSKDVNDKDSVKPEASSRRSNSLSDCSDQIDDDDIDDAGSRKRSGKKPQAKNLEAERRRRKKLNERLYNLRSLVPIISKLDKASILVDAITYLKGLKTQEKELQDELEELSNCDGAENNDTTNSDALADYLSCTGVQNDPNNLLFSALDSMQQSTPLVTGVSGTIIEDNKGQQMEPQVEVTEIDANKFFIRVFCEHKPGGLVRLLEALSSLGLEVMNVNVTSCRMLVSNVFEVELKRDSEVVAEDLKNSLLELTRIPFGSGWMDDQQLLSKPNIESDIYYHSFLNHHAIASPYHQQN